MTILTVASYTPADKTPRAFALSQTATSLQIVNGAAMRLQILLGASLVGLVNGNASVIFSVSNPSAVVVAPDQNYATRADATATGLVTITTYAAGDPLPTRNTYEQGTLAPISGQIHFSLERLRSGLSWNLRDFGAQALPAYFDDGPAIRAAADVARILGGGRLYGPAGTYGIASMVANAEIPTLLAGVFLGDGVSFVGDGQQLTKFIGTGGWQRNPLIGTYVPTREFWVSTTGNNGNAGTKASPFLTIKFAVDQCTVAGGGYLIHVAPGTYNEAQIDTYVAAAPGTQTAPNIILSDVPLGAKVISTASGVTARAFYLRTGWWVVGFEITGTPGQTATCISLDGSYVAAIGNYIHDFATTSPTSVTGIDVTSTAYTAPGIIIANNIIFKCGPTGLASHGIYNNGNGTIVANNLIVNQAGAGIHAFHTPSNGVVVGNTVYSCGANAGGGTILPGILVGSGDAGWTVSGFYVANNICVSNFDYGIREFVSGGAAMGACTYTNNLEFNNVTGAFLAVGGNVNANAVLTDPLFMNQQIDGSGDFRLRSTSPAINAGTDSSMPAVYGAMDLLGYTRPVGTHRDIGAYEYGSWAPPPAVLVANYNPTTGNKDIVIADMTIDGGSAASTGLMAGIALCRAQRSSVRGVTIKNTPGRFDQGVNDAPALLLDYCSDSDVSGVVLASDDGGAMGSGIMARYGFNLNIRGVSAQGLAYGNGVFLDTCTNVRLVAAGIGGCGGAGVSLRNCTDFELSEVHSGLLAPSVAAYPYTASQAIGNTGHGVYLLGSSGKILGLIAQRNGGDGLWIDGAGLVDVASVQSKNNTGAGVSVNGAVLGGSVRIVGARINANSSHGLFCVTAALALLTRVTDHVISGNAGAQLRIAGSSYGVTGSITAPGVPATTVALTNPFPFDMTVFITGGTMTLVSLDGSGIGVATSPIYLRVRAGGTITITYTVAPSWSWYVEN